MSRTAFDVKKVKLFSIRNEAVQDHLLKIPLCAPKDCLTILLVREFEFSRNTQNWQSWHFLEIIYGKKLDRVKKMNQFQYKFTFVIIFRIQILVADWFLCLAYFQILVI